MEEQNITRYTVLNARKYRVGEVIRTLHGEVGTVLGRFDDETLEVEWDEPEAAEETRPTVKSQLKDEWGRQDVTCEGCGEDVGVFVLGEHVEPLQGVYRRYRGTCHACDTHYEGEIWSKTW